MNSSSMVLPGSESQQQSREEEPPEENQQSVAQDEMEAAAAATSTAPSMLCLGPEELLRQCQEDASLLMARQCRNRRRIYKEDCLERDPHLNPSSLPARPLYIDVVSSPSSLTGSSPCCETSNSDDEDMSSLARDPESEPSEAQQVFVHGDRDLQEVSQAENQGCLLEEGRASEASGGDGWEETEEGKHSQHLRHRPETATAHDEGSEQLAASASDFSCYQIQVNPDQKDRAMDIALYSFARPHMRAFHLSWGSFFVAFFLWFSMTPLLSEIAYSLHLTHAEIWTSSCLAVASSAVTRILIGPLNDKYGARWMMCATLIAAAIPTGLAGWVCRDASSLYIVRFFIGVAGSSFVTSQFWTSSMFCVEISGTANALVAGWGNLGGGVAQVIMGSVLFPIFKLIYGGSGFAQKHDDIGGPYVEENDRPSELAWRTVLIFPSVAALVMAWAVVRFSDDTPKGNVWKRRQQLTHTSWLDNFWNGVRNRNTLLLFLLYGCSFGVEITMTQAAALYFKSEFGQSTESAAAIASVFGWMNLFARGIGGFASDMANAKSGMRGRLWCQAIFLAIEGSLVIVFSFTRTLAGAIVVMISFSIFVQAAEGTTFGIVPYVSPNRTGSIAGWVGAGGNVGGVGFSLLFRSFNNRSAFLWMGLTALIGSIWTSLIAIPGHRGLLYGQDSRPVYEHRRKAKLPEAISFAASSPGEEEEHPHVDESNLSSRDDNFALSIAPQRDCCSCR